MRHRSNKKNDDGPVVTDTLQPNNNQHPESKRQCRLISPIVIIILATIITIVFLFVSHKNKNTFAFESATLLHQQQTQTQTQTQTPPFSPLSTIYSPHVMTSGCRLTAVLADEFLHSYDSDHSIWSSLESFATVMKDQERTCLVIQTSVCKMKETLNGNDDNEENARKEIGKRIVRYANDNFRTMIDDGWVRLTILDHAKYQYKDCSKWDKSPVKRLSNIHYYTDEFLPNVDSHMLLFFDSNALFCRPLDISHWKDLSYVGSPWTQGAGYLAAQWQNYARFNTTYDNDWETTANKGESPPQKQIPFRPLRQPVKMVGNDRLTLLNRNWIDRAIRTCPQIKLSGIDRQLLQTKTCKVGGRPEIDIYLPTVLNGIEAPMPSNFEAGLFSVRDIWAEEIIERDELSREEVDRMLERRWGERGRDEFEVKDVEAKGKMYAKPFSIHRKQTKVTNC